MITLLFLVAGLTAFCVAGVYLVRFVIALWRRQWARLGRLVLESVALTVVFGAILWGCQQWRLHEWDRRMFGAVAHLEEPVFRFESERSISGKGWLMEVYDLPEALRERFAGDARALEGYPQLQRERRAWRAEKWRATPLDPAQNALASFVLSYAGDKERLAPYATEVAEILGRPGAFYSFLYQKKNGHYSDAELLVIDVAKGRLYIFSQNV